ncbi:MAG: sulfite exporter TauE/SafE family protein [Anaerocolumna sp.]
MIYIIFLLISFFASIVGVICGIGGGVVIKPLLDAFGILDVKTISFLSGCTVLAMSSYSFIVSQVKKESLLDIKISTPLAFGAALGGVIGKNLFQNMIQSFDQNYVGAIQAICLMLVTFGTLLYTINKSKIKTHHVVNPVICAMVGTVLGILSSFLGIGGGPINLVVLFYFFSMQTKTAAQNSLYVILFSQFTSLFNSVVTATIPQFSIPLLVLMCTGGVLGGYLGRKINRKISNQVIDRLFMDLMGVIIFINIYNVYRFLS